MSLDDDAPEETPTKAGYRSFLVRCWRVGVAAERPAEWRFIALEAGGAKPRRAFSSLDDLMAYLCSELEGREERGDVSGSK